MKTIEEVSAFLKVGPDKLIKTLIYIADDKPVAVLVRGNRGLNEVALKKATGATQLFLAREGQVTEATKAPPGFAGPVGLTIPVYADVELRGATGAVVGANQADTHFTGVDLERDVPGARYLTLRMAEAGDACARCDGGTYRAFRGIEVGHVFFLGTVYSAPMKCVFLDEQGAEQPAVMGCYGIGITRTAAAAIEQNNDANGIIWPMSIAPFEVHLAPLQMNDQAVVDAAEQLYKELTAMGIEVLFDDRDERPGAKFKDADLIGVPLRLAIGGRSLKEGNLELKWRKQDKPSMLPLAGAAEAVAGMVRAERARLRGE
jgi:prolyl-tRNA synthetase